MSTPTPRRPRTPSPTRQQLDELDDLLQRMLSLAVDPAAGGLPDPPAAPVAVDDGPPPAEELAPPLDGAAEEIPSPQPDVPACVETPPLPALAPVEQPPAGNGTQAPPAPRPMWAPPPPWLRPLVWVNRFFDRRTYPLGALGRWLRRPAGRAALGWTGLLLLAAAAVLLVRWLRWP